jgi:hypothetical protein
MEGIRAFLLMLLVLLGAGVAPASTSGNAGPTAPVASQGVSQAAPVLSAVPAPPAPLVPAPAPATPVPQTPKGSAAPAFKVVPADQMANLGVSGSSAPFFRGGVRSRASAPSSTAPAPHLATASPNVALYNGLNKPGLNAAGISVTPPDSTGAIGPNNYVEMVNSSIAVYDRSLNLVSSATLDGFVGVPGAPYCDPQIQWDPAANRWLFAFLLCNLQTTVQYFVVGWSRTSDPSNLSAGGWCQIGVQPANPYLFDFPKLGHNSNYLIVGGNFYNESTPTSNPPFVTAAIAWIQLPANGDTTCPSVTVNGTSGPLKNGDGVTNTFTPVPVNTDSSATDGYVVSAYDPSGSNNQTPGARTKLAVWHLDSFGVLHPDADIVVTSYTFAASALQLGGGTTYVIDTLDARLTQAVGDPATGIWTQHTVNGPGGRSVVDWYEITVSGSVASLTQQGTVSSPTDFVFNGAISPRLDGQGADVFYNRSSSAIYPVIAAQTRLTSTAPGTMLPGELVLSSSSAADTDFSCNNPPGPPPIAPCRWGDYSAATPDPVQPNVVWGTNEFNTASGPTPAWADENFAVFGPVAPQAPTGVVARAGDQSAWVGWTPSSFDAGTPTTNYKLTAYVGPSPVATLTVAAPATAAIFKGLTNGTTYTFTVIAINLVGPSPESAHSNPVTPTRAVQQAPIASPPSRSPVNQAPPAPSPSPR